MTTVYVKPRTAYGGVGFFGLLTLLLVGLKLAGVISWPWWAVLLPVIVPAAVVGMIMIALVLAAIAAGGDSR